MTTKENDDASVRILTFKNLKQFSEQPRQEYHRSANKLFNPKIPITCETLQEFKEKKGFYDTFCSEDQIYVVQGALLLSHDELVSESHSVLSWPSFEFNS